MSRVNLDALIPREDIDIKDKETGGDDISMKGNADLKNTDLEKGSLYFLNLRKPDFQRETNEWRPERVKDLIKSFLDARVIPAVILWQPKTTNKIFVIDGSHRLSALIAWINNDYGNGLISKDYFGTNISKNQIRLANETERLIKKEIGTYQDYKDALLLGEGKTDPKYIEGARRLTSLSITLQWVTGNYKIAEASFYKINSESAPINDTELELLKSREKPYSIAARAIIHSGTGNKYWSNFQKLIREEIEKLASEINDLLYSPQVETPLKTLDVPLAGKKYTSQTLELALNLVKLSNNINVLSKRQLKENQKDIDNIEDDETGETTVEYLKQTKKILNRICGNDNSSLGLHPGYYFYSNSGRYQITPFYAAIELIKYFEQNDYYFKFTSVRGNFEDFIEKYKTFITQINLKGSGLKSFMKMRDYYLFIINALLNKNTEDEILKQLKDSVEFTFLQPNLPDLPKTEKGEMSGETRSTIFLRDLKANPIRCNVCQGFLHVNSKSAGHIIDKEDDGKGTADNGQSEHFYCNTGYKNKLKSEKEKQKKKQS